LSAALAINEILAPLNASGHLDAHAWSVLAVGVAAGSVAAFYAIWGLLRILENFS